MLFRNARANEANALTQLTLASKRYWGYPEEWISIWTDELTISSEYIEKNWVVVAEEKAEVLGYASVFEYDTTHIVKAGEQMISGGFFLDYLFIHPSHIKKGIGEKLVTIACDWCKERQIKQLHVYSDPYSKGFYEKTGAVYIGEVASSSISGRTLPFLTYYF